MPPDARTQPVLLRLEYRFTDIPGITVQATIGWTCLCDFWSFSPFFPCMPQCKKSLYLPESAAFCVLHVPKHIIQKPWELVWETVWELCYLKCEKISPMDLVTSYICHFTLF